jgi:predicted GIY-YIG superfamily endonuclease
MKSESFTPDIIISGFLHLIWIVLFGMKQFNQTPNVVFEAISKISTGAAALLGSIILGASFLLGVLVQRFIIEVIDFRKKKVDLPLPSSGNDTSRRIYLAHSDKRFFLSAAFSIALVIYFAIKLSPQYYYPILTVGLIGEILIILAMIVSWRQALRLTNKCSQHLFYEIISSLENKCKELITLELKQISEIPEKSGIYLFSEGDKYLYIGRTNNLRRRCKEHINPKVHDAPFAFKLAREETGNNQATYTKEGSRKNLLSTKSFQDSLKAAKERISKMNFRYVLEDDPIKQALLEIYGAVVLKTPYNDFDTH